MRLIDNIPRGWEDVFEKLKDELEKIDEYLTDTNHSIPDNVFRAFELTPLNEVKVVMIADGPYLNSDGLAYSQLYGPISFSLNNIFCELEHEYGPIMKHSRLDTWAHQGVLLLNKSITSIPQIFASHMKLWQNFIRTLLSEIAKNDKVIFVLFGRDADLFKDILSNNITIKVPSPSPLSTTGRFQGCGVFRKIDMELNKQNLKSINWSTYNVNY